VYYQLQHKQMLMLTMVMIPFVYRPRSFNRFNQGVVDVTSSRMDRSRSRNNCIAIICRCFQSSKKVSKVSKKAFVIRDQLSTKLI
jgi:hypothetical protein